MQVKIDSYAVESTVHFPTDLNLLYDACRKSIDLITKLLHGEANHGWRKHAYLKKKIKRSFILVSKCSRSGGPDYHARLRESTSYYLENAEALSKKIKASYELFYTRAALNNYKYMILLDLEKYVKYLDKQIDLVFRRIIRNEQIPHSEKIFSLFEPYTEWIKKGKAGNKVELGLKVAVCTDQFGFVLAHQVMEHQQDVELTVPFTLQVKDNYSITSVSFDKGFWCKGHKERLEESIKTVIMPKKGKLTKEEQEEHQSTQYRKLRHQHAAVESDINCLEHHGLNRCPDRGKKAFKRYVSLGILSYNLHKLGNILQQKDKKSLNKRQKAA